MNGTVGPAPSAGTPSGEAREFAVPRSGDWVAAMSGSMSFRETFASVPESVAAVRAALLRFARDCRVPQRTVDAVALAASEAATNVVVHAYRERPDPGAIEVHAALASGELWVIVSDAGSGLRPRPDSPGLGLGLAIIAQVADGVDLVKPAEGGLELRMRFVVEAPAADAG